MSDRSDEKPPPDSCGLRYDLHTRFRSSGGLDCPKCRSLLRTDAIANLPDHVGTWTAHCSVLNWIERAAPDGKPPNVLVLPDLTPVRINKFGRLEVVRRGPDGEEVLTQIALIVRDYVNEPNDVGKKLEKAYSQDPRFQALRPEGQTGAAERDRLLAACEDLSADDKWSVAADVQQAVASRIGLELSEDVVYALAAESFPATAERAATASDAAFRRGILVTYFLELWKPERRADGRLIRQLARLHASMAYEGGRRALAGVPARYRKLARWAEETLGVTLIRIDDLGTQNDGADEKDDWVRRLVAQRLNGEISDDNKYFEMALDGFVEHCRAAHSGAAPGADAKAQFTKNVARRALKRGRDRAASQQQKSVP